MTNKTQKPENGLERAQTALPKTQVQFPALAWRLTASQTTVLGTPYPLLDSTDNRQTSDTQMIVCVCLYNIYTHVCMNVCVCMYIHTQIQTKPQSKIKNKLYFKKNSWAW